MKKTAFPANPLLAKARRLLADHKRRAKAAGCVLDYDLADLERLLRGNPTCAFCRNVVPLEALTIDHRTPITRGGRHLYENLAVVCQPCNLAKGVLDDEEFLQLRALLRSMHPRAYADVLARLRSGGARYARGRSRRG
jgi:hypothetical protein